MIERMAGFIVMCALVPLALVGYLMLVITGFFGPVSRGRAGVRALDHFVNATVFNGYSWESVSSHAWRARENKAWARLVIKITNLFQQNHCQRANKREQPVVDFILSRRLHEQTVGKKKEEKPAALSQTENSSTPAA